MRSSPKASRRGYCPPIGSRYWFTVLVMAMSWNCGFAKMECPSDSLKYLHQTAVEIAKGVYRNFSEFDASAPELPETDPIIAGQRNIPDSILQKRSYAHSLLDKIIGGQRFLETLDELSEIELPVGIVKSGGAMDYSVLIDRINFTPTGAVMEVFVSLELPQSGDRIAFNGKIPLSKDGGIAGTARIHLLGDHDIQFSNTVLLTIKGSEHTFVEIDCNGFAGISLDSEIEFSRSLIVPEDANGNPIQGDRRVGIRFTAYTQSLNDIVVGVSIPAFQVPGLRGVGFTITQAFMDLSDLANPPGLTFPAGYRSPFTGGNTNLWQGFYLRELEVRLPPSFANRQDSQRVSIGVRDMILDNQGFTGRLFAENVIMAGNMNGWTYTLEHVELGLISNQITSFQLAGTISVPMIKKNDGTQSQFGYVAQRTSDGNYTFAVQVSDQLKMGLWVADLNLFTGSTITITERENRFYPSATLNGEISIRLNGRGPKANLSCIRFEGMVISSEAPHFTPGNFGFGRQGQASSVSKYPVSFSNIAVRSQANRVGLAFDLTINIGGKPDEEGFGGTASLTVWAKQEAARANEGNVNENRNWQFDSVELSGVAIRVSKPGTYELEGRIDFFDADPVYGDGFKGSVKGSISKFGGVQADALFGRTDAFRYWFADALVTLKGSGVPLIPGVLFATGFGGGFYSNMRQSVAPTASALGRTQSGLNYIPDLNTAGIRAIMQIGTARPEAMNGDVALEVSINRRGGINSVTFTGNANFMSFAAIAEGKMKELASSAAGGTLSEKLATLVRGQVNGRMVLQFDNVNDVFHGTLEVFVSVAGGIVRGVGQANRAGWAVLHFERNDWYVLIGTPDQPIGLEVAKIFQARSYFMLGKNLPGSPPPPPQVTEILGNVDLDYMRDFNALQSGLGFAFGLHFIVDTGDLKFLMFYGRFAAGTGIDFMLKDYGENYHCAGSPGQLGINGWYANGQAYAFVMGKIGIKVNLKFYQGNFDILNIGAAAILQTKGPNPFWMKGMVGGYYSIMGGMVKGRCRFEVVVGKDCQPVGNENVLDDINIIAAISPQSGSRNVDVFNAPQLAFNIPVGEVFEVRDKENNLHFFRCNLEEFSVLSGAQKLDGQLQWNDAKDVVVFDAYDLLPGEKELKTIARLSFEERKNGVWTKVRFNGRAVEENAQSTFVTAAAPDNIPANNVSISYPIREQLNFYPEEAGAGFIQLKDGQPYLFQTNPQWAQKIRITETATGEFLEMDFRYLPASRKLVFGLPAGLSTGKIYRFEILNIPRHRAVMDANVQKVERRLTSDNDAATLTTKSIDGALSNLEIKSIYSTTFRSSQFKTFAEKMRSVSISGTFRFNVAPNTYQLISRLQGPEGFDAAEISEGLISMEAVLSGNPWYENHAHPITYDGYPVIGWMRVGRPNPDELGIPPVRDIYFENINPRTTVNGDALPAQPPFGEETITYNLGVSSGRDFKDLQRHAVNYVVSDPSRITSRLEKLIVSPIPRIIRGPYRIRLSYTAPGASAAGSISDLELYNRIPD